VGTTDYVLTSTGSDVTWSPLAAGADVLQVQVFS